MGSAFSGRNRIVSSDGHISSNHGYFFPSIGGLNYFSSHYYLGSKKFETADPENFLYGDLPDLNYMTHEPCPFPYKQPPKKRPIECLNALLFVHKETVKLVKTNRNDEGNNGEEQQQQYTVEFKFDCDCDCNVYVMCMLSKLVDMPSLKSGTVSDSGCWLSQKYTFEKGLEQDFSEKSLIIPLQDYHENQLSYDPLVSSNPYPLVIVIETKENSGYDYQSLMTICNFDKSSSSQDTSLKVLKQKFLIDGLEYIFHEIFGLENKVAPKQQNEASPAAGESDSDDDDDDDDDLGAECVICFTDVKDTIILPCRHFCLCASCAADLRYQASNCPICRAPFQALVQIQATQKILKDEEPDDDEISNNPELYSVPGHKVMSLLQALNGYPKIKKNDTSIDAAAPILLSTDISEENNGGLEDASHSNNATATDTAITIEPPLKEVVILLDADDQEPSSLINTEPLVETRGRQLPDLIPPGSIPGTPSNEEEGDEDVGRTPVPMSVEANIESSCSTTTTDKLSINSTDDLLVGEESSLTSQRTETSSLKSSTSSVGSTDALIRNNSK